MLSELEFLFGRAFRTKTLLLLLALLALNLLYVAFIIKGKDGHIRIRDEELENAYICCGRFG